MDMNARDIEKEGFVKLRNWLDMRVEGWGKGGTQVFSKIFNLVDYENGKAINKIKGVN